ncbi:receptor activity-modifying protein 1 [Myripristis murdjan]|uniref:receptor activity-modifying protein 1 n=1 Tax=Myripristis murdjan TaxID=586833 RepID=UPI0011760636|nr:receptor activity-modifying protein 1-like [Myripristis murdjan]
MESHGVMTVFLLSIILIWTGLAEGRVGQPCDRHMFDSRVNSVCLQNFNKSMETSGYQDRCPWPMAKGVYNVLKYCVDHWAILTSCKGWEFLVDKFFLDVHQMYFSLCNSRIQDPPLTTLIMLIVPGIIATLLVPALCAHLTTQDTERLGTLGF